MLCEQCKQRQASVHTVRVVNGKKSEQYLCSECAHSLQISIPSLMEILSGLYMPKVQEELPVCICGAHFLDFQKNGLLGCPVCYETFKAQLEPVIKRAQGGRLCHVGRRPKTANPVAAEQAPPHIQETCANHAHVEKQEECTRLRTELQEAVKAERYERAAELRDRLRVLEEGGTA